MGAGGRASLSDHGAKRHNKGGGPQSRRQQRGPGSGGGDSGGAGKDPLKAVSTKLSVGFTKSTKRQQDEDLTELEVSPLLPSGR